MTVNVHPEFTSLSAVLEVAQRRHSDVTNGIVVVFQPNGDVQIYGRCTTSEAAYAAAHLLRFAGKG